MICPGSYLEHLNIFAQTFLFIACKLDIGGQLFFFSTQRICKQIIKAFVSCFVLINVSVPVRIKDKSNLLYLTGRDDLHQVFRKGTVKTEILYTADCD